MSEQGVVAIIPARGGSKRLPRKNMAPFWGRPLLQYAIESCLASEHITAGVYVSTEDEEIAAVARELGATVIPRPSELAQDTVWTLDVIRHAVRYLEQKGIAFDTVARIHCSPQIEVAKIDEALELLRNKKLWEVFSVNKTGVEDAVIHVLQKKCVWQKELSVYKGVIRTDYTDIHTQADLDALEKAEIDQLEKNSIAYLAHLEAELRHSTFYQELRYLAGRRKKLWTWQLKKPLYERWHGLLKASPKLESELYSPRGHVWASSARILDVGCGFGMYWPILRRFGVTKFVGVDLFDLRRRETYFAAAQRYVEHFCPDCETQLIMDDARNLQNHDLIFDSFDAFLAVATASTKLGSTAIPEDILTTIIARYGAKNCIPVWAPSV